MLRRRSVRSRILVLVLVPVLAMLGLFAVVLDLTVGNYVSLRHAVAVRQELVSRISNLQGQLSAEQADAALYIATAQNGVLTRLIAQEHRTTAAIRSFTTAATSPGLLAGTTAGVRSAVSDWQAGLAHLAQLRAKVTSLSLTPAEALTAYTSLISSGNQLTSRVATPLLDGPAAIQSSRLVTMGTVLQTLRAETDLLQSDLAAGSFSPQDRAYFVRLAVLRQQLWNRTLPGLDPAYQDYFSASVPAAASRRLAGMEAKIPAGPHGLSAAEARAWTAVADRYSTGYQQALDRADAAVNSTIVQQSRALSVRLIVAGGAGLLAVIAAICVAVIISRDLVRQLRTLRESAIDLTTRQMPEILTRLRSGEDVEPPAEEASADPGADEVGQVQRAFTAISRSAVTSAIDEIKIRRGVNDVFRNLARRNQSLLTRQLNLLDAMERRVHDPEELADLFRIDHLTTRMRRHAEGLLILAGGSSGRIWRDPIPVIDVMRAAVAEVEDYTRVRVTSRTAAALAGNAVADVIHLLAELVENATMFSPAHTPVRVEGDIVARGLSVEIEDRGLGMSEQHLASVNARIADPPGFEQIGTDQLGLYIASQLAQRHDIKITLRTSPYGGVTAVVLIPRNLVVSAEEGEHVAAGVRELGGRPVPQLTGGQMAAETQDGQVGQLQASPEPGSAGQAASPDSVLTATAAWPGSRSGAEHARPDTGPQRRSSPARHSADAPDPALGTAGPVGTGPADTGPASTSPRGTSPAGGISASVVAGTAGPAPAGPVVAGPAVAGPAVAGLAASGADDLDGLPVRVPQASVAPQLLGTPPAAADVAVPGTSAPERSADGAGQVPASAPGTTAEVAPDKARSTMAALQAGWRRGRSAPEPANGGSNDSSKDTQTADFWREGE